METPNPKVFRPTEVLHKKLQNLASGGIFSSFVVRPKNTKFETQEEEEKIMLLLRQHFVFNLPWIVLGLILSVVPFFWRGFPFFAFLPGRYMLILTLGYYLLLIGFLLERFLLWFYNIYVVTDERIIDIDFYHLLFREISDCKINKIEDITYDQHGFFQSSFNYGLVLIQTAAEQTKFEFENVPNPDQIVSIINLLIAEEEQEALEGRVR